MNAQKGVSLIEVLLVIVLMGVIVILLANLPNSMNLISKSRHQSIAREIASKQIEDKRSISYANLANDDPNNPPKIVDARLNLLPGGDGTTLVQNCDPSICTNSEHIKQFSVTVIWKENNKQQTTTLKTLIGEGGL